MKVPILCGNHAVEVDFPDRTRVLQARPDHEVLADPEGAMREALHRPMGHQGVDRLVGPGARVLIAFDDLAVPAPPMARPDNRQRVIGCLLAELDAAGVHRRDITLLCANGLHRQWRRSELRAVLGDDILATFGPAQLLCHDAEDPAQVVHLGLTESGYDVEVNRLLVECDQTFYVNITWVPFNGGWKSTVIGLGTHRTIRHIHNPEVYLAEFPASCMEPERNLFHGRIREMGAHLARHLAAAGKKVFQVETLINGSFPAQMSGVACGDVDLVHAHSLEALARRKALEVDGQSDVVVFGLPDFMPYSMGGRINPLLISRMGLGYLFANYCNRPLVKSGGTVVFSNPLLDQWDPVHHPSYRPFWDEGLSRMQDPVALYELFAEEYAHRPEFIHRYRHGYGFHGVHPVQGYATSAAPRRYLGKIMAAGCREPHVARRMGWLPMRSVEEALEMAAAEYGPNCSITYAAMPPLFLPVVH
jgi:hypothetical protein